MRLKEKVQCQDIDIQLTKIKMLKLKTNVLNICKRYMYNIQSNTKELCPNTI